MGSNRTLRSHRSPKGVSYHLLVFVFATRPRLRARSARVTRTLLTSRSSLLGTNATPRHYKTMMVRTWDTGVKSTRCHPRTRLPASARERRPSGRSSSGISVVRSTRYRPSRWPPSHVRRNDPNHHDTNLGVLVMKLIRGHPKPRHYAGKRRHSGRLKS